MTENGIAIYDGAQRRRFLAAHLQELKSAMDDGVEVRGYFYWSAFDNFGWASTSCLRIDRDRPNGLGRHVRGSAVAYGQLARTGSPNALRSTLS